MDPGTLVKERRAAIRRWLLAALMIPCLGQCDSSDSPPAVPRADLQLSDHPKAAAAAARVRSSLEKDLSKTGLRLGDPIFIRAFKEERELELFVKQPGAQSFKLFRTYPIAAASGTLGPKMAEGDGQVPEGFYSVTARAMNPDSLFHLSFNIGFPNAYDRFHQRTGSLIMIHGNEMSTGCLAMTDAKVDEIFTLADAALRNGQPEFPVHIFPFRMTPERMEQAAGNVNEPFWKNLKEGHDLFEARSTPPLVETAGGTYLFH